MEKITTVTGILSSILVLSSIKARVNRGVVWNWGRRTIYDNNDNRRDVPFLLFRIRFC